MAETKSLHILWTNDNINTSNLMVLMYSTNCMANRLWDKITVIIWGAPVQLVAENEVIQEQVKLAQHVGVEFSACISCARQFGAVERLEELGIEVAPWVEPFTEIIQSGGKVIFV